MKKKRNARLEEHEIRRIEERVLSVAEKHIPDRFYVVAVSFEKESGHWFLRVFVENPAERISLKDCEEISRLLDPLVDTVTELNDLAYNLEVSSPGLNRVLKTEREFNFFRGQPVRVNLLQDNIAPPPIGTGILEGFDPGQPAALVRSLEPDATIVPVPLTEDVEVVLDPEITVHQ